MGDFETPGYPALIDINTKQKTILPIKMLLNGGGSITPEGALLAGRDSSKVAIYDTTWLYEWTPNGILSLGTTRWMSVKGNFAAWQKYVRVPALGYNVNYIYRRNLLTKSTILVDSSAAWLGL